MEFDFLSALKKRKAQGVLPVIPDIKCFSPKEGDLMRGRDPVLLAARLEAAGACVLSVVTEEKEFHGSPDLLQRVCRTVGIPVLRKDFIETPEDLRQTKEAGASSILLIYSCLGREKLEALYEEALQTGLLPFVETHTAEELQWAAELGAPLVGINNRNILELERDDGDVQTSEALLHNRPADAFLVAESGLMCGADARRAARAGADAVLVGTAILQAPDPAAMYRSMTRLCDLKVCGLMDRAGIRLCREHLVDVMGFVTEYPVPVPWNLGQKEAADLIAFSRREALSQDAAAGKSPANENTADSGSAPTGLLPGKSGEIQKHAGTADSGSAPTGLLPGKSGEIQKHAGTADSGSAPIGLLPGKSGEIQKHAGTAGPGPAPGICIVTGGTPEKVIRLALDLRPDLVQLHYTESLAETAQIAEALHPEGIRVIRSIPQDRTRRIRMFGTGDLAAIAELLSRTAVSALLIDSRDAGNAPAGGGSILTQMEEDPGTIDRIRNLFPGTIILGGGLTAGNIREAVRLYRPDMADVMTGVETSPGTKSDVKVEALVTALEDPH